MLQKIKPTTPSQRNLLKINNKMLKKKSLLKFKIKGFKNSSGRNNLGKIISYHKGGGHKRNYRLLLLQTPKYFNGIVTSIEYDPNRTANIASVYEFFSKNYFYIIAPKYLKPGNIIKMGPNAELNLGHSLPLSKIPEGCLIFNISLKKNQPASICKSAGTFAQIIEKKSTYSSIKLPSNQMKKIPLDCYAFIGIVSNDLQGLISINKAGRTRWLNKRPIVRGVAKNPVDHPNGGGEGKKSGKNVTPWGIPNQRGKTRKLKDKKLK